LRADLQQQVGASLGPVHLLLLDHSPAHKLVYSRLGKSGADSFTIAMAVRLFVSIHSRDCPIASDGHPGRIEGESRQKMSFSTFS
jgi:hypothetical protein